MIESEAAYLAILTAATSGVAYQSNTNAPADDMADRAIKLADAVYSRWQWRRMNNGWSAAPTNVAFKEGAPRTPG